ncbi:hypothetical protein [Robiginitalea sp. IMCC43444]|uniref:hypothetical protein n=1 Tax=Robiginitalea sp. IMCC43444 TaxID=3459121 RepID=UPI004042CDFA
MKAFKLLLFIPIIGSAQLTLNNPEGGVLQLSTVNRSYDQEKTDGSPYLEDEFKGGRVYVNGDVSLEKPMRYNAYISEIEIFAGQKQYAPLLKRAYITAQIGDKTYKMLPYTTDRDLQRVGYFNPLNEGEVVLLFKPEVKLRQGRVPDTNYGKYVPPTYIDISSYYLKKGEAPAEKIRLSKKWVLKTLGDQKKALQEYISGNKLNLRKESDVIDLLHYYNSL